MGSAALVLDQLRPRAPGGDVKWVAPENLHITLRFFGNLDGDQLKRAHETVEKLDGGFPSVSSRWISLGAFPSSRRVQVIWLGMEDPGGHLKRSVGDINQRLIRSGFGRPDKPFRAHVTLGRVRRGRHVTWSRLSDRLTIPEEAFSISTIALFRSTLTPQGPVYTPLITARAREVEPSQRNGSAGGGVSHGE
jgi:2'-5' RNA ligase